MKTALKIATIIASVLAFPTVAKSNWYLSSHVGLSQLSNQNVEARSVGSMSGNGLVELDSGFASGIGVGYQFNSSWAVELSWEYRSNDATTSIGEDFVLGTGNYASNLFFVDLVYRHQFGNDLESFYGAGISWSEEIDLDIEQSGSELSFSDSGQTGYQAFIGLGYRLTNEWSFKLEGRVARLSDINLVGERNAGSIANLDYHTSTIETAFVYQF